MTERGGVKKEKKRVLDGESQDLKKCFWAVQGERRAGCTPLLSSSSSYAAPSTLPLMEEEEEEEEE